ncbi:uncharacterized protein LOC102421195 isoform X1 [Myotis lucifugus]|uniref:uncharacterized protein LOC102421195 isoform X1 n=1 Tax=Myotis lucifugus TaxID=59463 RepID=UPI000CCBFC89|nr:uncharacterized protein LOC102421195 isoform X1 [Myotis lucifugus]XP_023618001.1 uncharacterized protein LOC102421195 isoform X1 [Myotis lucifugus]XP_023618002.1 uncharacterized protein LOC102421195 isoform X1 [Myotis lucifugus]
MVFGICCQKERLYRALYVVQIFILAGMVYYYFQESVGKTAPDHAIAGESSPPIGETLRPLWGLMDKCYPAAIQRRRVRSGKKQASKATAPETPGGLNDAAPKETDILSQGEKDREGQGRVPGQGAASPTPAGKEVAEEKEVAGSPGWEGDKKVPKELALPPAGKRAQPTPPPSLPSVTPRSPQGAHTLLAQGALKDPPQPTPQGRGWEEPWCQCCPIRSRCPGPEEGSSGRRPAGPASLCL